MVCAEKRTQYKKNQINVVGRVPEYQDQFFWRKWRHWMVDAMTLYSAEVPLLLKPHPPLAPPPQIFACMRS